MKSEPTIAAADAGEEPEPDRVAVIGAEEAAVGAEQHHPLEPDVEHAGALGDRLAERGEHERHAGEQAARDDARPEHVRDQLAREQRRHRAASGAAAAGSASAARA